MLLHLQIQCFLRFSVNYTSTILFMECYSISESGQDTENFSETLFVAF